MPDVDAGRVRRYLARIRENTEDIRSLVTQYEDDQILKDPYLLKALKYCLIEIAEAMADTLQHLLARTKGLATIPSNDTPKSSLLPASRQPVE